MRAKKNLNNVEGHRSEQEEFEEGNLIKNVSNDFVVKWRPPILATLTTMLQLNGPFNKMRQKTSSCGMNSIVVPNHLTNADSIEVEVLVQQDLSRLIPSLIS